MCHQHCMWNIHLACNYFLQNIRLHQCHIFRQKLFHMFGMMLQFLHKFIQILDKFIFMNNELHGFHQAVCLPGIEISQIILIILIQTFEIFLQKSPPFIYFFQAGIRHLLHIFQTFLQPYKKVC